jgi:hypothetical protein
MYWWHSTKVGINFGDWIGPYIFKKLTGANPKRVRPKNPGREKSFFTAGSIVHSIRADDSAIVWGSGAISASIRFHRPLITHAVRGPKTREIFLDRGFSCPEVYGDPGMLMPFFFKPEMTKTKRVGIVPHYNDYEAAKDLFSDRGDMAIINVNRNPEAVISDIASCEVIVSTSLHGLIIAHAYRIPAVRGVLTGNLAGGDFKFIDYHLGAGFEDHPNLIDLHEENSARVLETICHDEPFLQRHDIQQKLLEACPFNKSAHITTQPDLATSAKRK